MLTKCFYFFYVHISTAYITTWSVTMCVMYKQTRNRDNETECEEEWTRKPFSYCTMSPHAPLHLQSSVHCRFNERHLHWRLQSPSCIRSVHVGSMQWAPLVVQSKRVSIPNQTSQSAGLGRTGTGTSACRFGWWDVLHCPRTLCEQLFPCLVYPTG